MAHPIEEDQFDVSFFDAGVPSSKKKKNWFDRTFTVERPESIELEDYKGFEDLYGQFDDPKNRGLGFRKTVEQKVDNYNGRSGTIKISHKDKNDYSIKFWPDMGQEWVDEQNLKIHRAGTLANLPTHIAPVAAAGAALKGNYFYMPPKTKRGIQNVTPNQGQVSGTTTKGNIQSKEGALQTRISQFQAGGSKSTRDLNLTTEYAKGSTFYHGKGSRNKPFIIKKGDKKDQLPLKINLVNWVSEQMKKPEIKRPEDIDRRSLAIQYENGEQLGWLGMEKVFKGLQAGESPESLASHIKWRPKNVQSDADRIKLMSPELVAGEVLEYAKTKYPEAQAIELVDKWKRSRMKGYKLTQEAARRQGLSLKQQYQEYLTDQKTPKSEKYETQYQAGHGKAVKSTLIHPDKPEGYEGLLYNAPTSGQAVRLEERTANISGGNKPEHDINPYAAKLIGWPDTWAADFDDFADSELNPGRPSQKRWSEHFNTKQIEKVFEIPSDWSEQKVKDYFKREIEPLESEKQHILPSDVEPMDPFDWISQTQLDIALNGFAA